jgi:hypothetical protein
MTWVALVGAVVLAIVAGKSLRWLSHRRSERVRLVRWAALLGLELRPRESNGALRARCLERMDGIFLAGVDSKNNGRVLDLGFRRRS